MKVRFSRAARWLSGLPTILVVALWLVLWQAWPKVPPSSVARRSASVSRITYRGSVARVSESTLMQLPFVQVPAASGNLIEEDSPDALRLLHAGATAVSLERAGPAEAAPASDLAGLLALGATANAVFRPSLDRPRVFAPTPPREVALAVELSDSLRERNFTAPELMGRELEWTNSAWQVSLRVECAENGAVEDVFIESGTTNQAFNLALVRRLQVCGRTSPGARCRGVVTVSYGELQRSAGPYEAE